MGLLVTTSQGGGPVGALGGGLGALQLFGGNAGGGNMGLLDNGDAPTGGLLGNGWNDPRSAAILNLAGSMVRGDFGGGLIGANQAYQQSANANIDRLAKTQQIGINNIQLQQAMAKWKMFQDAVNGTDQQQTQAVPDPSAPQIALAQGADSQPSLKMPDGSLVNTGGIGPTNANATRIGAVPPLQIPAPSNNPYVMAGNALGITPRAAAISSMMYPEAFNRSLGAAMTPTEATRMALAAHMDPTAANAGALRKATFLPLTNLRPGGGALDYNNPNADGSPKLFTMPSQPAPGTINLPTPGTQSGFTNVQVDNAFPNLAASATAQATGKAAVTPVTAYSNGQPVFTSQLNAATGGAAAPGSAAGAVGNGRYPSAAPAAGPLAPALSPAAQAAGTEAGKGSAQQLVADNNWANGFATRMFNLNKSLTGLQNADTGPGSEAVNTAKSFLLAQTPAGLGKYLPGVDPSKIASYDEANKYLIQYAIGQAGSLGEGTDSKLATTLAGNANTHISNLAAQDVVRANMALERMKNAQVQQFNQTGLPADKYQTWASKWNSSVNPAVFAWDTMLPDAKAKAAQMMTPAQRSQFTAQYNWALQNHYIDGAQ